MANYLVVLRRLYLKPTFRPNTRKKLFTDTERGLSVD
jgi:hypothetical protein